MKHITTQAGYVLFLLQSVSHALCDGVRSKEDDADGHTQVVVFVHLKAVFIFHATSVLYIGPTSNFLRLSPSFLSEKLEVICEPLLFQPAQLHAAVSSDHNGSDCFRKAKKSINAA